MKTNKVIFTFSEHGLEEVEKYGDISFRNYRDIIKYCAKENILIEKEKKAIDEFIFLKLTNMFQLDIADALNMLTSKKVRND